MSSQNTLPLSEPMFAGITQHWGRTFSMLFATQSDDISTQ